MTMHRFFIPPEWIQGEQVVITGNQARQLSSVLRMGEGEQITVLDHTGWEYRVQLLDIKNKAVTGEVVERRLCANDPKTRIVVYQSILKSGRMDYVVQKCTEIGVAGLVPVIVERCIAGAPSRSRLERWRQIIREAAEQSGAGKMPELYPVMSFEQACRDTEGLSLIAWEDESGKGVKSAIRQEERPSIVNVFIGPEGGFSTNELGIARREGLTPVSLGKRLLRAETAGLVAATAILHELDEL